jgi:hypothetical protein
VARYRELIAMKPLVHEEPPEPITVECPRCGDLYVAELQPYAEWRDLEEIESKYDLALGPECPDHRHFFEVRNYEDSPRDAETLEARAKMPVLSPKAIERTSRGGFHPSSCNFPGWATYCRHLRRKLQGLRMASMS